MSRPYVCIDVLEIMYVCIYTYTFLYVNSGLSPRELLFS